MARWVSIRQPSDSVAARCGGRATSPAKGARFSTHIGSDVAGTCDQTGAENSKHPTKNLCGSLSFIPKQTPLARAQAAVWEENLEISQQS